MSNEGCPICHGDCASANPPVIGCPMKEQRPPGLPADLSNDDVKALFDMPDDDDTMHQQPKI